MEEKAASSATRLFEHGETSIMRQSLRTSMTDAALLASYLYERASAVRSGGGSVLCLPDELGRAKDHHRLALELLTRPKPVSRIHNLSFRGRGASQAKNVAQTSTTNDADDLISYCDARNLHHIDIVVSGRSIYTLLLALVKRPGLVRKAVLNDAAPEFDAVAIARESALNQRGKAPASWEEAVTLLKERRGETFPAFSDSDWEHAASIRWHDVDGKPAPTNDPKLVRFSNAMDYDAPQPRLWKEFELLGNAKVLLVHGENSALITPKIVEQMKETLPSLAVETAKGQGHVPALHLGDLPDTIAAFLAP